MRPAPGGFTVAEVATIASLAETFVPAAKGHELAPLAVEALQRAADPAQVGQLRLVLRLLENPVANLATAGRYSGISAMPANERERLILRWAGSPIALRRSAFQAFRKLLSFLAYAAPGPDGPNPLHAAIGYRPDEPPIAGELAPLHPLGVDRRPGDAPVVLEADVVVVGSGAGGGIVAAELAAAGRSVLVLEAGPFVDEASLPRGEIDAFSCLYLNRGLLSTWDGSIGILAGSAVGGGTLVNWMTCIDAPEPVRAEWAAVHGLDGLDGREWAADRAVIEAEIGAAETTTIPPKDTVILRGAVALGWEAAPTRRNGRGCSDCGSCPFGCPRGTKQSGIRAHLATAAAAGARVVDRAPVTRLLVEDGRVVGVEGNLLGADSATGTAVPAAEGSATALRGRVFVARAPQVVLAAGALRSPAILQASGLAHRAVGSHLRLHPVPVVAARMAEPVEMWRGVMQAAWSGQFIRPDGDRRSYVIESAPGHPGLLALALPWEGAADHAAWMAESRFLVPLVAVTRDGGEGRATLTRAGRVRIDYRLDTIGVSTLRHALGSMARIARAAGAVEVLAAGVPMIRHRLDGAPNEGARFAAFLGELARFDYSPNRGTVFSAHQMGTIRMGADAADHPADPRGRVRGPGGQVVPGLYVADTSTFPTGLGVNPMITVMTMAKRVSRTILGEGQVPD